MARRTRPIPIRIVRCQSSNVECNVRHMTEAESVAAFNEAYDAYKVRIEKGKLRPTYATTCLPGSPQKVAILALRYEFGAEKGLFNPHDARRSDPVPTLDLLELVSGDEDDE